MCGLIIRFVRADDSAALLRIYAGYIDTPVTFECALLSERAFAERIAAISAEYPYLVCEEEGAVVGYAYAHRQRDREAYQWNAELSVYLDPAYTRQGLGGRLYRILLDMLRLQGIRTVYAGVTVPNPASERLHESMGFIRRADGTTLHGLKRRLPRIPLIRSRRFQSARLIGSSWRKLSAAIHSEMKTKHRKDGARRICCAGNTSGLLTPR